MGEVELDILHGQVTIHSHIITYGHAATPELTEQIRDEIETMWNEPKGKIFIKGLELYVQFRIAAQFFPAIDMEEMYTNTNSRNNYFRIEEYANGNISFVDGPGCNSGYFKLENLYAGSTTAAHEYGHTLGLNHPANCDYRGKGVPGIMYPRGTLVDPQYQYDPTKPAGVTGGTMHPMYRKVLVSEIGLLKLERLGFEDKKAIVGEFSNIYHPDHKNMS